MTVATPLSLASLDVIANNVAKPAYHRDELTPGIVHIGVGNFHRAHLAVYLHKLLELGLDKDWAIVGAGVRASDDAMRECLARQDWLTTVIELDPAQYSATIIGPMVDFVATNGAELIAALAKPEIRIVSLTITEGGYFVDAQTGGFDHSHPDIVADANNPGAPKTVFGIIIAALIERRAAGLAPFTVMSCDNLPDNGSVTKQAVLGLARCYSEDVHNWISRSVAFPNSMVDCITPATGDRERAIASNQFGIVDEAPVVCEPFRQWVLEDNFSNGRPAFDKVGVEFVDDVAAHELMKLRILNGGHAAIAYPAALMDIEFVHDAIGNPLIAGYLSRLTNEEIIPTLSPISGVSFDGYYAKTIERFANHAIGDTVERLCLDGSNRQPKFIVPTVRARLESGHSVDGLALACALWCRYCYGTTDSGRVVEPNDPNWQRLNDEARRAKDEPLAWLQMADIYGALYESKPFADAFASALHSLWQVGVAQTLTVYSKADCPA